MPESSIFADEWRECLRAHYMDTVRDDDQVTLKTLVGVMHEVGFTDDDLSALYLRATMRAEDLPADFVPDASQVIVQGVSLDLSAAAEAVVDEIAEPEMEIPFAEADAEPLDEEAPTEEDADPDVKPADESPQQLSLFDF
jgi:hypothetical protein